jgi:hypothetical protein
LRGRETAPKIVAMATIKITLRTAAILGLAVLAGATTQPGTAGAAVDMYLDIYGMEGEYAPTGTYDIGGPITGYQLSGSVASSSAKCTYCTGALAVDLSITKFIGSDPCRGHFLAGSFSIAWADGSTSSGTLGGKWRDSKAMILSGTVDAGSAFRDAAVSMLFEPFDPCQLSTFSGVASFGSGLGGGGHSPSGGGGGGSQ